MYPERKLEYGELPSMFLGLYPLTIGVQLVCFFNLVLCVCCIALASSAVSFWIDNFEVQPALQVAVSSWSLLGVMLITGALVGCSQRLWFPLQCYFYHVAITDLIYAYIVVRLLIEGPECMLASQGRELQRVGSSFSCGLITTTWVFCAFAVWIIGAYGAYTVWQLKEHLKTKNETQHLLAFEDPVMKNHRAGKHLGLSCTDWEEEHGSVQHLGANDGHALQDAHVPPTDPNQWASPRKGLQPEWGALQPKSTAAEAIFR